MGRRQSQRHSDAEETGARLDVDTPHPSNPCDLGAIRVADRKLRDTQATFDTIVDQSFTGVYMVALDTTFAYVNARFAELFGYTQAEMIGRSFLDFVVEPDLARRREKFGNMASGKVHATSLIGAFTRKDGTQLDLLSQSTLGTFEGRPAIVGLAFDITEQLRNERALQRLNHALRTLNAANAALVRGKDEPELLREMCTIAVNVGGYAMAWIGLAQEDEEKLVRVAAHAGTVADYLYRVTVKWDESDLGRGPTGTAIRTGAPVIDHDYAANSSVDPWRAETASLGFKSSLSIPLTGDDGSAFGVLTLYAEDADAFDKDEVELLVRLGSDISFGVAALRNRIALHETEERSRRQAERLEAFWRIVNNPGLSDNDLRHAMLEQAAAAIRPGEPYVGGLGRIDDEDIIYESVAATREYFALRGGASDFQEQRRVPLAGSAVAELLASGDGTRAWDDLQAAFPSSAFHRTGTQSGIFTAFRAGGSTYVLWFVAPAQTGPWSEQDRVYVEVLASFFQNHIQERWQSDRLLYHQTHDVLTGLLNRSQFRSQTRMAAARDDRYAVIALDIDGFGEINERYGNMIGDALLVEVAAAFLERSEPGEITGRLGGNLFAVFIPNPPSRDAVHERALRFMERFAHPFSTGDREGKAFITLSATVGIAMVPEHGTAVDEIISHASAAVSAVKTHGRGTVRFYETEME
jgi:diguanylate cyclase (GGDEF)-like protein/PAS domain S-box-containing protein